MKLLHVTNTTKTVVNEDSRIYITCDPVTETVTVKHYISEHLPTEQLVDGGVEWSLLYSGVFDTKALRQTRAWSDAQVFTFVSFDENVGKQAPACGLFELTVNRRMAPENFSTLNVVVPAVTLFVPFAAASFDNLIVVANSNPGTQVVNTGFDVFASEYARAYDQWLALIPKVAMIVGSVNAEGAQEVDLQITNPDGSPLPVSSEIWFDLVGGILLTPRVITDSTGKAKAYVSLNGLPNGYKARLKAGWRFFTSVSELELTKG